jgi:amino acid transporter
VNIFVIVMAIFTMDDAQWSAVLSKLGSGQGISNYELLVGFSSAWLAFSGLESISQLSPTMRLPTDQTF